VTYYRLHFMTVRLRLFAFGGMEEQGMPYYEIVVGAPGPGNARRKSAPKLPKKILL
jgi:hypothetical protein